MSKQPVVRKYGKRNAKSKAERLFVELPQTPVRDAPKSVDSDVQDGSKDEVTDLTSRIDQVKIQDENSLPPLSTQKSARSTRARRKQEEPEPATPKPASQEPTTPEPATLEPEIPVPATPVPRTPGPKTPVVEDEPVQEPAQEPTPEPDELPEETRDEAETLVPEIDLRILSWSEVCPPGDKIVKIAEASYAEVYRVTNERGTSIIKVIRMESPIKPQTKAQQKSGLVDEEPHSESDLMGELKISEWLADIPGFVVYKERQDPGRAQFYPSPSRYLDGTRFLVVELGDAGIALEDFVLNSTDQLWDIFLHVAIALARAEAQVEFEHRDLHEGNLCIRQTGEAVLPEDRDTAAFFGHSGLEITILDYGLSRARGDLDLEESEPIAYDLERDLSIFTSEHAPQCRVYRQMRSFLLRGDRTCLPPKGHQVAYQEGIDGPLCWALHEPYTNVLWLAYIYEYLIDNFQGLKKELNAFKRATKDFWTHLNPEADDSIPGFASASDIVMFAVESGWIDTEQLTEGRTEVERSILSVLDDRSCLGDTSSLHDISEASLRRSPRRNKWRPSA
ncbi:Protein kinase-like domain [Apiospora rasikravindrae]|uniref:non-specific serine/threonine protein kinase n=1 Tax=Apiospora rasikravindrae TaxID=990691 RepID=A0ABR1RXK6_9PEZI